MSKKTAKTPGKPTPASRPAPSRSREPQSGGWLKKFFSRNRFAVVLFCLCFVVFGNGINNEYALDDEFYTAGANPQTQKGVKGLAGIFTTRTFYNNDGTGYSYRPIALASFAIEIQLFGEKPHVSHFINVLLYALTLVVLFRLLRRWFTTQGDWFSFFICLIFLVHPLHTEVVDNIKCRDEILSFLFGLLTLRFVWDFAEGKGKWQLGVAAVMFVMAMLSKSTAVILVALVPVAVWYWSGKKWWTGILYVLPLVIFLVAVKTGAQSLLPETKRTLLDFENPAKALSKSELFATAFYVMARYYWLHIVPHPLIFYYGLNEVPVGSWSDPIVIIGLLAFIGLGIFTLMEVRKKTVAGFGLLWFMGNIFMVSNLLGAAPGIMAERFVYSATLGFSIAVVDLLFRAFKTSPVDFEWKRASTTNIKYALVAIAVIFSLRSIIRNEAWEDKETLYRNDVELAPKSAKINMLLGSLLSSQGAELNFKAQKHLQAAQQYAAYSSQLKAAQQPGSDNYMRMAQLQQDSGTMMREQAYALFREARMYYETATTEYPDYYTAWSNLGTTFYFTHEYRPGIPLFKKAIAIKRNYSEAYFNLGMSYEQLGTKDTVINQRSVPIVKDQQLLDSSFYFFEEGLKQDSSYMNIVEQLSRMIYTYRHDSVMAMSVLNKAAADNPKSAAPWNAMSSIYFQAHDTASGVVALEMAAKLDPDNFNRLANLANYFYKKGNMEKASYYKALYEEKYAVYQRRMKLIGKEVSK